MGPGAHYHLNNRACSMRDLCPHIPYRLLTSTIAEAVCAALLVSLSTWAGSPQIYCSARSNPPTQTQFHRSQLLIHPCITARPRTQRSASHGSCSWYTTQRSDCLRQILSLPQLSIPDQSPVLFAHMVRKYQIPESAAQHGR